MKLITTTALVALAFAPAAFAGSVGEAPSEVAMAPVVEAAAPTDWSGFYVGLAAGKAQGDHDFLDNGVSYRYDEVTGVSKGLFLGYNFQRGNLVYGAELALNRDAGELDGFEDFYYYPSANDLKLRIGYAWDNILFYGFGGASKGEFHLSDTNTDYSVDGMNYGIGAEMLFNGSWLVGLEVIHRELDGGYDDDYDPRFTQDGSFNTLQLRIGYKF